AKPRLIEGKIAILRISRDLVVAEAPQVAVLLAHDRPEVLEPGAAESGILREQEIAAPEALARNSPVGLRIDREEDAGSVASLRHALREHQEMPVRIGIDGAGTQRVLVERHRIIIGVVVVVRGSPGSGMDP